MRSLQIHPRLLSVSIALCSAVFGASVVAASGSGETFAKATRAAEGIREPWVRAVHLAQIACAQADAGQREQANATILRARLAIKATDKKGTPDYLLHLVVEAELKVGEREQALRTARRIVDGMWRETALGHVEHANRAVKLHGVGDAILALRIQAARETENDAAASHLAEVALALARRAKKAESEALFREAVQAARACNPVASLLEVARCQVEAGQESAATGTLELALGAARANKPGLVQKLGEIIRSGVGARDVEWAREVVAEMAMAVNEHPVTRPEDRAGMLAELAVAQASVRLSTDALGTADRIESARERAWALKRVADTQIGIGTKEEGLTTIARAVEAARAIPPAVSRSPGGLGTRAGALAAIGGLLVRAGQNQAALELLEEAYWQERDVASRLWRTLDLSQIGESRLEAGAKEKALRTLAEAAATALGIPDQELGGYCAPHPVIRIVELQARAGDLSAALSTALAIPSPSVRSEALVWVVAGQATACRFDEALVTASLISSPEERVGALVDIGITLARREPLGYAAGRRLLSENPQLVRLKELEVLREIGARGGNHFYIGLDRLGDRMEIDNSQPERKRGR